ncbi:MAG: hypothetical protein IOB84_13425 [Brevundimonas sp.]|nr:hypothetical protein [Brevundimonas sp.]
MTPAALRAMRAALDWSIRDLAAAADASPATILKAEQGGAITRTTERRIRAALARQGVRLQMRGPQAHVRIGAPAAKTKQAIPADLVAIEHLRFARREDGSYRVTFDVPARNRPPGWPNTRPVPTSYPRQGHLSDPQEVAAIIADAKALTIRLEQARRAHAERAENLAPGARRPSGTRNLAAKPERTAQWPGNQPY